MNIMMSTVSSPQDTTGTMLVASLSLYTLELPWVENEAGISCVPAGMYELVPYVSPKHGITWCLDNKDLGVTPDGADGTRSRCEIHSANWARQLLGCIAVGLDNKPMIDPATGHVADAVESSRDALVELVKELGAMSTGHTLTIIRN